MRFLGLFIAVILTVAGQLELYAQNAGIYQISVQDKLSGKPLSGVAIKTEKGQHAATDRQGGCTITLPEDNLYITVVLMGYVKDTIWTDKLNASLLNVIMRPMTYPIDE